MSSTSSFQNLQQLKKSRDDNDIRIRLWKNRIDLMADDHAKQLALLQVRHEHLRLKLVVELDDMKVKQEEFLQRIDRILGGLTQEQKDEWLKKGV